MACPLLFTASMVTERTAPRILVVEDEPEVRGFVTDALSVFGYDVTAAGTADEALAAASRMRFDLVLSDLRLPGLRGWDFVVKLRTTDATLPVIMLTGSSPDDADLRRVCEAGIPVLHKPVQLAQLQAALGAALRGRAA